MRVGSLKSAPPLIKDRKDKRDLIKAVPNDPSEKTPKSFSLRKYGYRALEQAAGSCAAYAATQLIYNVTNRWFGKDSAILISPFELYWNTRKEMGVLPKDTGSDLRTVMKVLKRDGTIPWKWFPGNQRVNTAPPKPDVHHFRIQGYERITVGEDAPQTMRDVIGKEKLPIIIGVRLLPHMLDGRSKEYRTGNLGFAPTTCKETYGHAMLVDGYQDDYFQLVNSWGPFWGNNGFGQIHQSWFTNDFCLDIWTLSRDHA